MIISHKYRYLFVDLPHTASTAISKVFGPYMEKWGYTFPPEWNAPPPDLFSRLQFVLRGIVRRLRWRYMA
ncbi:MAG: hypothetical protein D6796_06050 [Caldilineae bacterium]|nr:MAG: hypothetical protein D6796_06050 [Caldilineae bacterium]